MNDSKTGQLDQRQDYPPLRFKEWDPDDDSVPPNANDPVLLDFQTAQVQQRDAFFDVLWDPDRGVVLTATLHPSDTMAEMRVTLPALHGESAMALARALIWAAYAQEGEPCDD